MTQNISSVSVIICAYTEDRLDELINAVQSVHQQSFPPSEIILVIDHNPLLKEKIQGKIAGVQLIENRGERGLSGARNSGIAAATGQIIAFLDDDAIAMHDWLKSLCEVLTDPRVLGVGGSVLPIYERLDTTWFPEEFLWVVGCTYQGMPQINGAIRNPIGANMAFRRTVFAEVGGFRSEIGRVGTRPVGCEETELCIRAQQHCPEGFFLFDAKAIVYHHIPAHRLTWRYYCVRCYFEGVSKAFLTGSVGIQQGLASERSYLFHTLPKGIARGLADPFRKKGLVGLARSGAILVGLTITLTGYIVGTLQRLHPGASHIRRTPVKDHLIPTGCATRCNIK